jgi:LmbE family N-acetylglucosaminyl deacetylase
LFLTGDIAQVSVVREILQSHALSRGCPVAGRLPTIAHTTHHGEPSIVRLTQSPPVTFNPALPGTHDREWLAALRAEAAWSPKPGPLLIVSPHPDDEVLGAGGLIRMWSERGHRVIVLSVTDGEAAYPEWRGLDLIRRAELDQALATLSSRLVRSVRLALPDGRVRMNMTGLIGALRKLCESGPTLVAPFEADGHPDHEAVASGCFEVAEQLGLPIVRYPIWAWHHAGPAAFAGTHWGRFALDAATQAAKRAAMNCFVSQLNPGNLREPIVPAHVLEYFTRDYEAFLI